MYSAYFFIILGFFIGIFEWPTLLTFLSFPIIQKNLKQYAAEVPAPHSFVYSLKIWFYLIAFMLFLSFYRFCGKQWQNNLKKVVSSWELPFKLNAKGYLYLINNVIIVFVFLNFLHYF